VSDDASKEAGSIVWTDLTTADAETTRDFYEAVVGWKPEPVSMGEYDDFSMTVPESGSAVAGICHARGPNAEMPSQWLVYILVADLDASAARCTELGGKIVVPPKGMAGHGRYCVIQDPAGAVAALFEQTS
jgi:predicted enzyme related to lactoylglutathione lyase